MVNSQGFKKCLWTWCRLFPVVILLGDRHRNNVVTKGSKCYWLLSKRTDTGSSNGLFI